MTGTIAAIYARLSRDKTKGTDREGESLESQVRLCTEWIERQGWTVGEVYRDNDVSATTGKTRPDFERLLADVPERVVYRHQDRLERGPGDLDRFLLSGIEGYGTDGSRATLESASGEFMTRVKSLMSAHEGRLKAERIKAASLRNAETGRYRGSIRPFGQTLTGERVEAEAEAVRWAVDFLLDPKPDPEKRNRSFHQVAVEWNSRGLLTPATGKPKNPNDPPRDEKKKHQGGCEWTSGTVRNYFTRPRLYGMQEYKGTLYKLEAWVPLLSREEFEAIQVRIAAKRTGSRTGPTRHDVHLLTGILRCAECGRGMNVAYRGGKGSTRSYKCPTVRHVSVVAVPAEDFIIGYVLNCLAMVDGGQAEEASEQITALLKEKIGLETAHEEWITEAAEAGLKPSAILARERKHTVDVEAIEAELVRLRGDLGIDLFRTEVLGKVGPTKDGKRWSDILNLRTDYSGFRSLSMEQQRDLVRTVLRGVSVSRGGQGKRFDSDRLDFDLTEQGKAWTDAWFESERMDTWKGKDHRHIKPAPKAKTGDKPFDPNNPWANAIPVHVPWPNTGSRPTLDEAG